MKLPASIICSLALLFTLLVTCPLYGGEKESQVYILGTGTVSKNYYPIGQALAEVTNRAASGRFWLKAVATNASIDNLLKLQQGIVDTAFVLNFNAYDARKGRPPFKNKIKWDKLFALYPSYVLIIARKEIKSLYDIKNKRVWRVPKGGGQRAIDDLILDALKLRADDLTYVAAGTTKVNSLMMDGVIDVAFHNLPYPSGYFSELLASGRFHFLSIPSWMVTRVLCRYPCLKSAEIEVDGRKIRTIKTDNIMISRHDLPNEVKKCICNVVKQRRDEISNILARHPRGKFLQNLVKEFSTCEESK